METVRVSSKGQIVIPKRQRTEFRIVLGSDLAIFADGDTIHLRRAAQRFERTDIAASLGLLARPERKAPEETEIKPTAAFPAVALCPRR